VLLVLAPCALAAAGVEESASPGELWDQRIAFARTLRRWIAAGTALLLAADWIFARREWVVLPRLRSALLVLLALATLFSWWHPHQTRFSTWLHVNDAFHYYLGAKYFDELRYTRLYRCAVVADAEAGLAPRAVRHQIRNLETNRPESADVALRDPQACKRHFSPERWQSFASDLRWFRQQTTLPIWFRLRGDHGYNPPPTWTMLGS